MKHLSQNSARSKDTGTCDYCGLPMSGAPLEGEPSYCCFGCRFADGISKTSADTPTSLTPASALGLCTFFTMNVVMMTMALWSYADSGSTPFELALRNFLRYGAMAFSAPVLLLLGRPLFSHAVVALQRFHFSTDLLLTSGVVAAFTVSVINTVRDSGHVYFEVGCVILVLVTLGRWLEASGRSNACQALEQLERLVPDTVTRCSLGREIETPRLLIEVGDEVRVLAGQRIPLDGHVVKGRAVVDEQFFTGESTPVEKHPGDCLLGGSLNLDGDIILEVTSPPTKGALGRLIEAVKQARLLKGRYQQISDTWSQWFFPVIGVIAVAAFIYHGLRVDWDHGLLTALAVILIACPCALALATPLVVWTALATAARKGVLFRSGEALESLAAVRAIRWDKTGTLTTGTPRVVRLYCESPSARAEIESLTAGLTDASNHVFSKAIREFLSEVLPDGNIVEVKTVPGRGLQAKTLAGVDVRFGSISWMDDCGLEWGSVLLQILREKAANDGSFIAIGYDGQVRGLFLIEETIRAEAVAAVEACRMMGLDQAILTGDRLDRASKLAMALELPTEARLLPEEKLAAIRRAHEELGRVAMIGDGLNDAPALAAADVGIALGCGADVSRDSAGVCLLTSDLRLVPWACEFSRKAVRTIRTNLAWSFGYNSIGVVVAASGYLHPAVAAALMVASSLMVLGNSLRLSTELAQTPSRETEMPSDVTSAIEDSIADQPRKATS